jgi:hypothetical protein
VFGGMCDAAGLLQATLVQGSREIIQISMVRFAHVAFVLEFSHGVFRCAFVPLQ